MSFGNLIILSGPSGAGKTTLAKKITDMNHDVLKFSCTYTTRKKRNHEQDTIDYHFIMQNKFDILQKNNFFIESVNLPFGYSYGTPHSIINDLKSGKNVVMVLDRNGVMFWKDTYPDVIALWITCEKHMRLERLKKRHINDIVTPEEIEKRFLQGEIETLNEINNPICSYIIENTTLSSTLDVITSILTKYLKKNIKNIFVEL